jgi:hypothetical protein
MKQRFKPTLIIVLAAALFVAFLPGVAQAQEDHHDDGDDDVLIRINGDVTIAEGDAVDSLVVIDADATIDGTVNDNVLVIHGNAIVNGTIGDRLTVIDGDIDLRDGARVNDVNSISGDLNRASGAQVSGHIHERDRFSFPGYAAALFSIWAWLALTVFLVVVALVFAAVGGRQLTRTALVMTGQAVNAIVGGVFLWIALPILAVIVMLTVVGILLGVAVFLFFLPIVFMLGYIVAATRLGLALTGRLNREGGERPLLPAALGVIILQIVVLIPFAGWLIGVLAGLWGGAAIAYTAFAAAGGKSFDSTAPSPQQPA